MRILDASRSGLPASLGLPKCSMVYRQDIWKGQAEYAMEADEDWFDQERVAHLAELARGQLVCVDIEHRPLSNVWHREVTDADIERTHDLYGRIIETMQDAAGGSLAIGMYSVVPKPGGRFPRYPNEEIYSREKDITRAIGRMMRGRRADGRWDKVGLADHLQVMMPDFYSIDPDPNDWVKRAERQYEHNAMFGKPIYAFLWQRFALNHVPTELAGTYVGDDYIRTMLDTCKRLGMHAIWWDWGLESETGPVANLNDKRIERMTPEQYASFHRTLAEWMGGA